jgi:UDP-glucose 4-epimerase
VRVLVTGAGGYIGRHLIPKLKAEGHEVIQVLRIPLDSLDPSDPYLAWHSSECCEANLATVDVDSMLSVERMQNIDTVIHLAGRVEINLLPNPKGADLPPIPGPCDIGALYRDNVLATANVLDYCLKAGVKHLIFASTQAVYGMGSDDINDGFKAWAEFDPLDHYATSKLCSEELLKIGRTQGLSVSILRLPGVFGGDRKTGAVYNMCRDALQNGEIHVNYSYPLPMNVMHIDDVVGAIAAVVSWKPPTQGWVWVIGLVGSR